MSLSLERLLLPSNAKDIRRLYLIFAILSGLLGTVFLVLIRLELSGTGVQSIADNQLYNSIIIAHAIIIILFMLIIAHAILIIFFMVISALIRGLRILAFFFYKKKTWIEFIKFVRLITYCYKFNNVPSRFCYFIINSTCPHGLTITACALCLYVHNYIGSECGECLAICVHNNVAHLCCACMSLVDNINTIAQSTHDWYVLYYDVKLLEVPCDYGSVNESHTITGTFRRTVYSCRRCHAIMCEYCFED